MMRKLIICNDGTWNSPDDKDRGKVKPTNITKISRAIKPVDSKGISQIVFYDEGVGTGFGEKMIGGITGFGISKNIRDSYRFLSHNYKEGDEIYIFGFSRGAYTSSSLIGLISKIGLLRKDDVFYLEQLFELYKKGSSDTDIDTFCVQKNIEHHIPRIKMLGVFDTVGAMGVPFKNLNNLICRTGIAEIQFHMVSLSSIVDNAYQALAIDEKRVPFVPVLWDKMGSANVDMEQRWFAGVHSNVGGGYNPDGLANFSLKYIISKAKSCGLEFDSHYLSFYGGDEKTEIRNSMSFKYRLLGEHIRKITLGDESNQVIDNSVKVKVAKDGSYRPENIK